MNKDLNIKRTNNDFTDLGLKGVLLLNSALTVEILLVYHLKLLATIYELHYRLYI